MNTGYIAAFIQAYLLPPIPCELQSLYPALPVERMQTAPYLRSMQGELQSLHAP